MKLADGQEVVARLELPLPMTVAAKVLKAVDKALTKLGYTDVVLLTDGTYRIVATPPARGAEVRRDDDYGHDPADDYEDDDAAPRPTWVPPDDNGSGDWMGGPIG